MNIEFPELIIGEYPSYPIKKIQFGYDKIDNLYTCEVHLEVPRSHIPYEDLSPIQTNPWEFKTGTSPMMAFEKCITILTERVYNEQST